MIILHLSNGNFKNHRYNKFNTFSVYKALIYFQPQKYFDLALYNAFRKFLVKVLVRHTLFGLLIFIQMSLMSLL